MKKDLEDWGFVYFVMRKDTNVMKVGMTAHPQRRLPELGVPESATLYRLIVSDQPRKLERIYHDAMKMARLPTSEWFVVSDDHPEAKHSVEVEVLSEISDYSLAAECMIIGQHCMDRWGGGSE